MKVLIACEFSGIVRDEFLKKGHDAISCDLLPSESSGPHYQGDVLDLLNFEFDLMIAHPPCTYLTVSGLHWNYKDPSRNQKTKDSLDFVKTLMNANIPKIALENPIGIINTKIRKPDQIIQPWQFGHRDSKKTCLWLKGLPILRYTDIVGPSFYMCKNGHRTNYPVCCGKKSLPRYDNQTESGQNKLGPSEDRWKDRSRTYLGIAQAMADQWG